MSVQVSADKKSNHEYDKRTHDERIAALRSAFTELSAIALVTGKKTDASQSKVLKKAGVHKSYFHGEKIKDKATQQRYFDVHDEIKKFQDDFSQSSSDKSVLSKAEARREKEKNRAVMLERQLIVSREEVVDCKKRIAQLQERDKHKAHSLIELSHQVLTSNKQKTSNFVDFTNIPYVSPDQYLTRNGVYCFDDDALRKNAWARSERELHEALNRPLPMRVYILIGPPCAGKSSWARDNESYWNDRHPVVIDATNLTIFDRMKWFKIINQYIRTNDIHVCGVVFITPLNVLFARNNVIEQAKKMASEVIKDKFDTLEWPDLQEEMFQELVVVRHD
ncbi:hypothetical protein Q4567_02970 [Aliiglaciecola sp. 2_MG-2023]|uniref:hypothetical protein n=1 Tax=unclassified Aliiglaciecola TaxID=2593648 RepID=UPI0026E27F87|nr:MULTISPECIES: hypothetical protein [unclassified Aliiglaciecola]MDO6709678.1 hypothetical protein [Aliiglaciecola sp. 2_MG-2023]MDO6750780.1 hypothetical protein [Aliiglaciecola sp. 1_MG-2023]